MMVAAAIIVADLNHLLEYLFIALAIVVLTRQIASRDRRLARTSLDLPILAFLGWILISIVRATDPTYSFAEWRKLLAHVLMFFGGEFHLRRKAGQANSWSLCRWCVSDECLRHRGVFSCLWIGRGAMV